MTIQVIKVPDIGGAENVDVIEVCIAPGDSVQAEQSLLVLETDKASMEVPCPEAGKVVSVRVNEGDTVSEGDAIVELDVADGSAVVEEAPLDAEAAAVEQASAPEAVVESAPVPTGTVATDMPIVIPDLGGAEDVDVIEVCVSVGDHINEGDSLIVLETDKASMEVPAPASGELIELTVSEGDKVSEGITIGTLKTETAASAAAVPAPAAPAAAAVAESASEPAAADMPILIPDLGGAENVDVIEVCVSKGDQISEGDSLIVLETDKASMEVPAPASGELIGLTVRVGDKVSEGFNIGTLKTQAAAAPAAPSAAPAPTAKAPAAKAPVAAQAAQTAPAAAVPGAEGKSGDIYAGPAVRKLARQLGVDLGEVKGTGPRGRMTKDDVRNFVKQVIADKDKRQVTGGSGIPPVPEVDFSQFGPVEMVKMSKIKKLTAANMSRNWLNVPHVTQWDDADITELEAFRKDMKAEAEKRGTKLTPLPFLLKACAAALRAEPNFNVSMHADGEHIVQKDYVHIGIAADTPAGLMVPVLRDVDKKGLWQIADEVNELIKKARDGKLTPRDMQGGCFTISSLGAMGGHGFTPIVNVPEVAILGVSRAQVKPVWNGSEFEPRNMLPLSLSYDHRAINGADCGRFFTYLVSAIADIRRLLL